MRVQIGSLSLSRLLVCNVAVVLIVLGFVFLIEFTGSIWVVCRRITLGSVYGQQSEVIQKTEEIM